MPEMPEVETIVRKLRRGISGKLIESVWLSGLNLRKPVDAGFGPCLTGRTIRGIHRRGKYVIVELEPRAFWLIHLGMSGRIFYRPTESSVPRHTHARIRFSDSSELIYSDHRRFGLLAAYMVVRMEEIPELGALGKDPLSPGLNSSWLRLVLKDSRQPIKSFLLDQRWIAGLGNIYACEALFHAGVRPTRRCCTLKPSETRALVLAIRKVIRLAVRNRGTSFSDFMDSDGELGDNQHFLRVFQREGEECGICRTRIRRRIQANRSSFYCPRCQV